MSKNVSNPPTEKAVKSRCYNFVFYPESAPENWKEVVASFGASVAVSPLHDKDVKNDGTPKKPHFHGIIRFDSVKSDKQVKTLLSPLGCNLEPKPTTSEYHSFQYFSHSENPEKAQYNKDDIQLFSGYKIPELGRKRANSLPDIIRFIRDEKVYSFSDLTFNFIDDPDSLELVLKYSYALDKIISELRSRRAL